MNTTKATQEVTQADPNAFNGVGMNLVEPIAIGVTSKLIFIVIDSIMDMRSV
jgi:hypothetical protein